LFDEISKRYGIENIAKIKISASNDINEISINESNTAGHNIDIFGIGTNLVTCQLQPFININVETKKISTTSLYKHIDSFNEFLSEIISDKSLDNIKEILESGNIIKKSKTLLSKGSSFCEKDLIKSRSNLIDNLHNISKVISLYSEKYINIKTL
jgi:nicotinic acid phosphoribosyltransferase